MKIPQSRCGYTLPVFACAAAVAALHWLRRGQPVQSVLVDLINPDQTVEIPIEQAAGLQEGMALAITRSAPGDNLDLIRDTPIWALVEWIGEEREQGRLGAPSPARAGELGAPFRGLGAKGQGGARGALEQGESVLIKGGEGIGRQMNAAGQAAIYAYAQQLLRENLARLLKPGEKIQVTIILPEGRRLASRTSNAAFGVVEGLSLLGTRGISQPLSAPGQLEAFRDDLLSKASCFDCLVFCVGENGLDLAQKLGINKTASTLFTL